MPTDDVRSRVAKRISDESASLSTSALGRPARWVAGLATAGAKSIGRSISRTVGLTVDDVEPEAVLTASLGQLKGPMMKVGQMLGYVDVGLPPGLRAALSALHTSAQPLDVAILHRVLDEDLGDPGSDLARAMQPKALSAGSVGQVHRAALPDGAPVAVKVLHPGVSTVIERDLWLATVAGKIATPLGAMTAEVRERLLEECDYTLEAERQERFRAIFAGHPTIVVPQVHAALSSARVLTTAFVEGVHIEAYLASERSDATARSRAGEALFDFYIAPLFKHGVYNSDPHPGNYLFLPDGRVAFVDFGCVREFGGDVMRGLTALMEALMASDRRRMHDALVALGGRADVTYDRESTWKLLHAFFGPLLRDEVLAFDPNAEVTLRQLLWSAWKARRLATSGELLFLLRTFLGLSSVLARLGARSNWRRRLTTAIEAGARAAAATPGQAPATAISGSTTSAPQTARQSARKAVRDAWDVVLVESGSSPIALIRALRELLGHDLRDLEAIVDHPPEMLRTAISRADAEALRQRLAGMGARVEVRRASAPA
jgi:predicted unusual protein kinase regulating ubiquinone biosynthesis (AarF/ABC1/UbiB family)